MGFWDRVKEELKKMVDEGWGAVKEGAKIAAEKGEEMAKVGKLRYQEYQLHRKAERRFADLGGMVYELAKPPYENPLSNPEVMKIVEEIKAVEDEIASLEEERKKIKQKESSETAKEEPESEKKQGEEKEEPKEEAAGEEEKK